jgi:hypothetical protein
MGPTRPLIEWVLVMISSRIKRPGREADHLTQSSDEVKNGGAVLPLHHMSSSHSD